MFAVRTVLVPPVVATLTTVLLTVGASAAAPPPPAGGTVAATPAGTAARTAPAGGTTAAATGTFRNWLRSDFADPWIFRHGGRYYGMATRGNRITMVTADSVAALGSAPERTVWSDSTPSRCCNVWAPEAHLIDGAWYIYYAADDGQNANHRMYVLRSSGTDPFGPYAYAGRLIPSPDTWAIDGTVLRHSDGRLYFIWSGWPGSTNGQQNLYISAMTGPTTLTGQRVLLSTPTYDWEKAGMPINEGPAALQRNGTTYLFYSASGCWTPDYKLGLLTHRTGDILDPRSWSKSSTPVFQRSDANGVYGPGHNSVVTSPDGAETWFAYHATADSGGSCGSDRSTRMQRMSFASDGTPRLGTPSATYHTLALPSGDPGAPPPVADGTYMVMPEHVDKALDVAGCSTAEGADVIIWPYWGGDCQKWRLEHLADRRYRITAVNSGRALTVVGCSSANGADAVVEAYRGDACQQWYVEYVGPGDLRISAAHSGRALDVGGCSSADGANVITWPYWGGGCQQWRLRAV